MNPVVVQTIPARINPFAASSDGKSIKKKVAGYARVSTELEEQQSSYDLQVNYYTGLIKGNPDWEFAGMYADEGITGTSTARRKEFNKMIAAAMAGKIDLILTKSISRFARNTVDCLTTIRKLKEKGVEVFFEKENIHTLDAKGELLITIMSSLAQEESRSISENTKWGRRKRMAEGKFNMPYKIFLGYDPGPDFKPVINEEQAKTVRQIYQWYLDGLTLTRICQRLEEMGVKSPTGRPRWHSHTVYSILTNEKYKGSALLQKKYVPDFLTKKQKKNEGELPKYYIEDSHPAIISKEMFEAVQAERQKRHGSKAMWRGKDEYSCKVQCGCCGDWFALTTWHSEKSKYRKEIFRCRNKYHKKTYCQTGWFKKEELQGFFMTALNERLRGKDEISENLAAITEELYSTTELEEQMAEADRKRQMLEEMRIEGDYRVSHRTEKEQEEYDKKRKLLQKEFDEACRQYDKCQNEIMQRNTKRQYFESVRNTLDNLGDAVTEFDVRLWCNLLDHMVICVEDKVTVVFRDGIEIYVPLEDLFIKRKYTRKIKK